MDDFIKEFPLVIDYALDDNHYNKIIDFVRKYPQFYGQDLINKWIENKLYPRLCNKEYKSIFLTSGMNNKHIEGNIIYRTLDVGTIEIKSMRVSDEFNNRNLARTLLRQLEYINPNTCIKLDTSLDNTSAVNFFMHMGFKIVDYTNGLYNPNKIELLMLKENTYD